ncbi:Heterokaryon incompatibility [Fusarium austroafricanum]|uniref:Heterokaryon incompatibility n=1 Tax=Fusarium austroafricanum TaxID=2364996 RepID=A0A8H4KVP0_9HYPO|nr:Heterokaryon incompatibility [Fusarium austroafricanum]
MDHLNACEKCHKLSAFFLHWEVAVAQGAIDKYEGQTNFFLGTSVDLEARSSNGCKGCRSILSSQDVAELEDKYGKAYGVSMHFQTKQPLLWIAWGNIDAGNEDAGQRRAHIFNFKLSMMLSTNPVLTGSAMGRGRPYDLEGYNVSLIRRWIERCDKHHGSTCSPKYRDDLLPKAKLSFIDVEELCIVTPNEPVRYAALSYVWGGVVVPVAKKANITSLRVPGAFPKGGCLALPATIHDAVRLCANIGIQYLWVDSMCIVQDDMQSKMEQIEAMGSVYANAHVTFVALMSEGANSGLPRVPQDGSSSNLSPFIHLPYQALVKASQGAHGLPPMIHSRTLWTKRAWTLQESVLSKRLVCLGPVTSWACSGAEWTEDLELPSEIDGQSAFTGEADKLSIPESPDISHYSSLASVYACRQLTMPEDTVNAFEGIMTLVRQHIPGEFLFGIPEFLFDIGLLWQHRRRGAKPRSGLDWTEEKHEFPSWSWISHQGQHLQNFWETDYLYPRPDLIISPLVKWKKQDKASKDWEDVDNLYHTVRKHFEKPDIAIPDSWARHTNEPHPPYYQYSAYSHMQPSLKFSYPIPVHQRPPDVKKASYYPHLLFEGSLAQVRFQFQGTAAERDTTNRKLLNDALVPEMEIVNLVDGAWVGRVRLNLQQGSRLPEYEEEQEVIAISEGKITVEAAQKHPLTSEAQDRDEIKRINDWYKFVNVLWIGRTKDNKVYRKALGRIWLEAWERMAVEQVSLLLT